MSELQIFKFNGLDVRTVLIDGEPYFVGTDVAKILGYSQTAKAVRTHVPDKFKGVSKMDTPGGKQETAVVFQFKIYTRNLLERRRR